MPKSKVYNRKCLRCSKPIRTLDISAWVCAGSCRSKLRSDEALADYPTVTEARRAAQIFKAMKEARYPTGDVSFNRDKSYT